MKKILLASVGLTLLLASTPLAAKHRYSRDVCRIGHPAYYYQSHGSRPHHRYRSNHYYRHHDYYRHNDRRGNFRRSNRFYRGGRGHYRSYRPHPSYYNRRHHHRRPRIGIYFEF